MYNAGPPETVVVGFDSPIVAGVLDFPNWTVRYSNLRYIVSGAVSDGAAVTVTIVTPIAEPGVNDLTYAPPPFDVIAVCGTPAAAFAGFPIL